MNQLIQTCQQTSHVEMLGILALWLRSLGCGLKELTFEITRRDSPRHVFPPANEQGISQKYRVGAAGSCASKDKPGHVGIVPVLNLRLEIALN